MLEAIFALLKALPEIARIISFFTARAQEKAQQGVGYGQAMKDVLEEAHKIMAEADAERILAEQGHNTDPTDGAFDTDFQRS